jgi:hypothetical protein
MVGCPWQQIDFQPFGWLMNHTIKDLQVLWNIYLLIPVLMLYANLRSNGSMGEIEIILLFCVRWLTQLQYQHPAVYSVKLNEIYGNYTLKVLLRKKRNKIRSLLNETFLPAK